MPLTLQLVAATPHSLQYFLKRSGIVSPGSEFVERTQAQMLSDLATGVPNGTVVAVGDAAGAFVSGSNGGAGPLRALLTQPGDTSGGGRAQWNGLPLGPDLSVITVQRGDGTNTVPQALLSTFSQDIGTGLINVLRLSVPAGVIAGYEAGVEIRFNHSLIR